MSEIEHASMHHHSAMLHRWATTGHGDDKDFGRKWPLLIAATGSSDLACMGASEEKHKAENLACMHPSCRTIAFNNLAFQMLGREDIQQRIPGQTRRLLCRGQRLTRVTCHSRVRQDQQSAVGGVTRISPAIASGQSKLRGGPRPESNLSRIPLRSHSGARAQVLVPSNSEAPQSARISKGRVISKCTHGKKEKRFCAGGAWRAFLSERGREGE